MNIRQTNKPYYTFIHRPNWRVWHTHTHTQNLTIFNLRAFFALSLSIHFGFLYHRTNRSAYEYKSASLSPSLSFFFSSFLPLSHCSLLHFTLAYLDHRWLCGIRLDHAGFVCVWVCAQFHSTAFRYAFISAMVNDEDVSERGRTKERNEIIHHVTKSSFPIHACIA